MIWIYLVLMVWVAHFRIDDFENLTNKLCYLYARCTRAVSVAAPAYYAHLVAARARVYYQAVKMHQMNVGNNGTVELPEVHEHLRNRMYYL